MARGQVSPVAPPLPKVSFQKIEDDVSTQPSGVHDGQARSFGYNDFSEFHRPDQYIRHIEPLEIDLERQVEYDMDEQDQEWLDAVNAERKKEQLDKVSHEVFEVIMDRLEKEWFNLTKHIPKPDLALPSEDSTCAICDDSEGENSNAIVFCDGCNLAVHQDCYGVPYIPEGQWLCRKCTVSPENPVSCILCPNEGGAFKQTTQGEWIHLLCAIWVPETRVSNDVFMEPIIGVERISKQRWKLKCAICETREGACIQCAKQSCFLAFHVTCARKDKLLLPMKSAQGSEPGALTCYCDRHLPKEQAEIREAAQKAEEEEDEEQYNSAKLSKSARAYAKTYKPGPPLVPAIIIDRILQYISRTNIRKKPEFIAMMCKYWSLKREARRGAPLLKRLHLEPWTASTSAKMQGEEEKVMKLEQLQHLRKDLEDLKGLTELSRKRESRKLRQAELIHDILSQALFVHVPKLRAAFERIVSVDRQDYFKNPVSKKDVPDYFDIVQNPMSWSNIESKLDNYQYWDIQSFKDDIHLVLNNAVLYNKEGTAFHRTALRILATAQPVLADLNQLSSLPSLRSTDPNQVDGAAPSWAPPLIGDLEPPLEILELLISSDAIQDESDLFLSADPITSLFNFELERKKPLPPPPTPPPDPEEIREKNRQARALNKEKRQKEKEVQREKRKARRAELAAARAAAAESPTAATSETTETVETVSATMSAPPELRFPRTRGALAAEAQGSLAEASSSASAARRRPKGSKVSAPASAPVSMSVSGSSKGPRQRRSSAQIPTPGDIPLVEHVDQKDSFTMFEKGWILPVGTRRGGRVPLDRPILPPPKKKMRMDRGSTSRLSVFSTAASENQTLQDGSPREGSAYDLDDSMDVDSGERPNSHRNAANRSLDSIPPRLHSLPGVTPERVTIPPPNVIRTPDGKVIIEELDTPAIRKEKKRQKKQLAAEAAAAAAADATTSQFEIDDGEPLSPISASDDEPPDPNEYSDADAEASSDLSEMESEGEQEEPDKGRLVGADGEHVLPADEQPIFDGEQDVADNEDSERDGEHAVALGGQAVSLEEQHRPDEEEGEPARGPEGEHADADGEKTEREAEQVERKQAESQPEVVELEATHAESETEQVDLKPAQATEQDEPDAEEDEPDTDQDVPDADQDVPDADQDVPDADQDVPDAYQDERLRTEQSDADGEQDQDEPDTPQEELTSPSSVPRTSISTTSQDKKDKVYEKRMRALGCLMLPPGQKRLEPGTLVWAKAVSYPWWPAIVFHDTDTMIPTKVLAEAQSQRRRRKGKGTLYIVRFFDKTKSWQYLPLDKMRQLGEIKELDDEMLAKNSVIQGKSWKGNLYTELTMSYQEAMEEMESGDEKTNFMKR